MEKRVNIGVYISPNDIDIAAWFNLLKRNNQSYTRWIKALLAAYTLNDSVRIGVIDRKAPLIRGENGEPGRNTVDKKGAFHYGWQVRGPEGEYVIGSVINVSVSKQDLQPVLEEAWTNGHKLSTFVKSLIRKNLKVADKDIPPKMEEYSRVWSAYLVFVNSKNTDPDRRYVPKTAEPEQDNSWVMDVPAVKQDIPVAPKEPVKPRQERPTPPKPAKRPDSERAFSFADDEPEEEPRISNPEPQSSPTPGLGLNPLVGMI